MSDPSALPTAALRRVLAGNISGRYIFVGDPHAVVDELDDCHALTGLAWGLAKRFNATVVLAGDLYNTHEVVRAEVLKFWYDALEDLCEDGVPTIVVKGNHDYAASDPRATPLLAHLQQAVVVDEPFQRDGVLFCPHTTNEQLVEWSQEHRDCHTLVCHQTFDGSRYENGQYAGDGVDPARIAQRQVISGHLHTPQEFGKVWYPGAPRWRTLHDANVDRALWLLEFDPAGNLLSRSPFDTSVACRRLVHFVDTPASPVSFEPLPNVRYRVDVRGPRKWVEERRGCFPGALVRTTVTDTGSELRVRESDGVAVAFAKWAGAFKAPFGTSGETLLKMARENVGAL